VLVLAGAGCTRSAKTPASRRTVPGVVAHVHVFQFVPKLLKVKPGTTVTWVDDDEIAHTATSGRRDYAPGDTGVVVAVHADGLFDLALNGPGQRGSYTFTRPGTFHYFCNRHPGMEADVAVAP
jgi:plastocyanin